MTFYIIEYRDSTSNRHHRDRIVISEKPALHHDGKPCHAGLASTSCGWVVNAHGVYRTLEDARELLLKRFSPCREEHLIDSVAKQEGVKAIYFRGKYKRLTTAQTIEWLREMMGNSITAHSWESVFPQLLDIYEAEANEVGRTLKGCNTMAIMKQYHQELQEQTLLGTKGQWNEYECTIVGVDFDNSLVTLEVDPDDGGDTFFVTSFLSNWLD